ncbi:BatD family protein [Bordetella sp. BOR01]|uniref:BatD family protein n=1 Tax=Bordetella sp. BOR01 TaxID=2854779 RepID=UPI001C45F41C|nr:BatD family protein [Bordetella sp. BOR01]MBV7482420.1 BatD family protein [Bordetella sp. BOR01]
MIRWQPVLLSVALLLGLSASTHAQDGPVMQVTARLQAPADVVAGTTLRLELEVMTPTWFTQPPQLPGLDLPGVMVTPPSGQGDIVHDKRNGVAYSGLRYTYILSPTAPGAVQIPALTVSAQVGPGKRAITASSSPLSFSVQAGSDTGSQGVATGQLNVSQDFSLAPNPLVAGGRVTRSVTQRADGVQAMLLPAAPLINVPGFKRYPREPEVTTLTDGRGGFIGGQRIDRADYIAQQAGTLSLPAVTLHWRDSASGQLRQQELPGQTFAVGAAPSATPPFSLADDLAQLRHGLRWVLPAAWLAWAGGVALVALALWLTWPWWRRGGQALRAWVWRARVRRRASEPWHWHAWRREARQGKATLSAFYRWLARAAGTNDLRAAVAPLGDPACATAAATLRQVYAGQGRDASWRTGLLAASRLWRRAWRARCVPVPAYALPPILNPGLNPGATTARPSRGTRTKDQ